MSRVLMIGAGGVATHSRRGRNGGASGSCGRGATRPESPLVEAENEKEELGQ